MPPQEKTIDIDVSRLKYECTPCECGKPGACFYEKMPEYIKNLPLPYVFFTLFRFTY